MLTTYTSPLPHTWVLVRSNQHSSHADGQLASAHNLPALYIYPLIAPIKPLFTEPLSVTVPVVFDTCTVLVGTVESIPVPPQQLFLYRIWSPSLSFTNAKSIGGTLVDASTLTYVERASNPAPDTITRAVEANVFSGLHKLMGQCHEMFDILFCSSS